MVQQIRVLMKRKLTTILLVLLGLGIFVAGALYSRHVEAGYNAPQNRVEAEQRVNWLCNTLHRPVGHAAWVSDISSPNTANGSLSYKVNVVWRRCDGGEATRAYAVIGYAGSETAVCPDVGTYGSAHTHDCVKYIGNPNFGYGSSLACPGGSNWDCVNGAFNSIRADADQPRTGFSDDQMRSLTRTATVPDWSNKYAHDNSYTFHINDAICAYYKTGSGYNTDNSGIDCQDLDFTVYWQGNYTLTPSITGLPRLLDGDTATVYGSIANSGKDSPSNTRWTMQLLSAAAANTPASWGSGAAVISDQAPCDYFKGSGVNCSHLSSNTESIPNTGFKRDQLVSDMERFSVGTRVCVSLSVQAHARDDPRWAHTMICTNIGKRPKVQVLGGDLWVGKGNTGNVNTSSTTTSGRTYGSWSEYGVLASGAITGMASGSGYVGGATTPPGDCQVSLLTFANAKTSAGCTTPGLRGSYGGPLSGRTLEAYFKGGVPLVASNFDVSTTASGIYAANRVLELSATQPLPKGGWIVIKSDNQVTIKTDIMYTNEPLHSMTDIPQLLIFAKDIVIEESVRRVDAWLMATNSVSTCSAVSRQDQLTANTCSIPLTVNGPLRTKQLFLNRTAGAGIKERSGDPAEVFNLRPDAYLWVTSHFHNNRATRIVYTKELPPRF